MRIVIQRVRRAAVSVDGTVRASIGAGLFVLVGVACSDTEADARRMAEKTAALRIFDDTDGVMNLPVTEADGELLAVSQFTLLASTRHGNRPSYIAAARPEQALPLYERYCELLSQSARRPVERGVFGADMQVELVNDGPVTIVIDSDQWNR